jgi:excinuclease ABC subunit C
MNEVKEQIEILPTEPGVYLFKDAKGEVIYVGKALNLRNRVRSYFNRTGDNRYFVGILQDVLREIETIVTANEKEAIILENNLIKKHHPRFNVMLRDDKEFLCLRIDESHAWPRVEVVRARSIAKDGARYFGPYHSAQSIRETLRVINKHFQLRTCSDHVLTHRSRPCILYQIKRCPGPCVYPVDRAEYGEHVGSVMMFLEGRRKELARELGEKMERAAGALEFEKAAIYRDQLRAVTRSLERQNIVSAEMQNQDVFGFYREGETVEIQVLSVRQGRLTGGLSFSFKRMEFPDAEILSQFLGLFYDRGEEVPEEVLLPVELEDTAALAEWLGELAGRRKVEVLFPRRGERRRLVELATRNAENAFRAKRRGEESREETLQRLQRKLHLRHLPEHIECFDMAHLQGGAAVGSMVVFAGGIPDKTRYRHYRIKTASTDDDFAMMNEVLSRRYRRALEEADVPDLIVIDGGKGQLGIARAVLEELGIEDVDVISLAKSRTFREVGEEEVDHTPERVFLPGVKNAIVLRQNSSELFLLTRLRDEAHRFANVLHDKLRRKSSLRSALQDIPGIGAKRQRALLKGLGSLKRIREASLEELAAVPGMSASAARAVHRFLHGEAPATAPSDAEAVAPAPTDEGTKEEP